MATTMRALVREYQGVALTSKPLPVIRRGWVLIRVRSAAWTPLEDAVAAGSVWVEPGRVMGFSGFGVVVEAGIEAPRDIVGKRVAVKLIVTRESAALPGLSTDGWLAEYTSLPSDCLEVLEERINSEEGALASIAGMAWSAARALTEAEGRTCILGAGTAGLLAAYAAKLLGREVTVYSLVGGACEKRLARELGIPLAPASSISGEYAAVFISALHSPAVDRVVERVMRGGTILLHPVYHYVPPPRAKKARVELVDSFELHAGIRMLKEVWEELREAEVGVVERLDPPPLPAPKRVLVYLIAPP